MMSQPAPSPFVIALLLAAGSSRRFGSDKRQARLPCGRTVLQASLDTALTAFEEVRVVLRATDGTEALGLPATVQTVRSEQAESGMGHSLASGIRSLADTQAQAVAILLADMPWLRTETLLHLADRAAPQRIVMPVFEGQQGHPVIIGRAFWPLLEGLTGDQGARAVIKAHPEACIRITSDDPGTLLDADTPAALAQALAH
ncbi:nucleotidyltransferase family protein [Pseudomonas sp. Leaf127]|uniref:nucleotidyltransferase family protein n=1 Tax=Pseudomonas sp. Leaf127 TaxID=1736267 RepID=UPI003FA6ED0E